ncbi:MAG: sprT domain-containing protein [Sphingobacteriales bacterium]|nr:MAG: sprT domain-containing protein [Sphingobacteriales bacterium]TAF83164.1 MAG: sprT domain-containing protein [Sphingobacteriales bacterium]
MPDHNINILEKYIPEAAAPCIAQWINDYKCQFKISRSRSTKLGDYTPPQQGKGHKISVNHNLNKYAFLVTTVHEFAHLHTWNQHQNKVPPHGAEWKANFKTLMHPFFVLDVFPPDLKKVIVQYLQNPAASSCSDISLLKALNQHNINEQPVFTVESLPLNSLFEFKPGKVFKKTERVRKRYKCIEVSTNLVYLFSPLAEVKPLKTNE